jgi:hypothetical protein
MTLRQKNEAKAIRSQKKNKTAKLASIRGALTLKEVMKTKSMNTQSRKLQNKQKVRKFFDHYATIAFMTLLTIYALFFEDIRILASPKEYDDVFYGITLMGIIIFTLEVFFASFANPAYIGSFFFYLDIISTLTMIPDCGWIWTRIIENG